jgi:hypothetical protein
MMWEYNSAISDIANRIAAIEQHIVMGISRQLSLHS